jgi:hypothetical protein
MTEKNRAVPKFEITLPRFPMLSCMIVLSCLLDEGSRLDAARRNQKFNPSDQSRGIQPKRLKRSLYSGKCVGFLLVGYENFPDDGELDRPNCGVAISAVHCSFSRDFYQRR